MYSHCLSCRSHLGTNEAIEAFPVGTRLAFDGAKGRLWVVCRACSQWNLTPLEERWEAVEECEKRFRAAKVKVQGEEIGLAKDPSGLELVRVGKPHRPELAAWRYGTMIARRRRGVVLTTVAAAATGGLIIVGLPALGASSAAVFTTLSLVGNAIGIARAKGLSALRLPNPDGAGELVVTANEREGVRLVQRPEADGGWGVDVPYARVLTGGESWLRQGLKTGAIGTARFSGAAAVPVLAQLLPQAYAGRFAPRLVTDAVTMIEQAGGVEQWFPAAAARVRSWAADQTWGDTGSILNLPKPARLALLIAAHEDDERRAMEGALAELEERWKQAEEIAAIADDLFLPAPVTQLIARFKGETRG